MCSRGRACVLMHVHQGPAYEDMQTMMLACISMVKELAWWIHMCKHGVRLCACILQTPLPLLGVTTWC
jgi:hypothetical protein